MKQRGFEEDVDYLLTISGTNITVDMNISLKSDKSEILDNIIIKRKVYS